VGWGCPINTKVSPLSSPYRAVWGEGGKRVVEEEGVSEGGTERVVCKGGKSGVELARCVFYNKRQPPPFFFSLFVGPGFFLLIWRMRS